MVPMLCVGKCIVKFRNFRTPENFSVIYLKFKQRSQSISSKRCKWRKANSEDSDQTAPLGAV